MKIEQMTRQDFEQLPYRESWDTEEACDSIVILPAEIPGWRFWWYRLQVRMAKALRLLHEPEAWESIPMLHDSGFRCMDYVAVVDGEAVCRISGCSDVLHIEGIGGYGYHWLERCKGIPRVVPVAGWSFDSLPASGLLRLWPSNRKHLIYGCSLSSFEIYSSDGDVADKALGWEDHLEQSEALLEAADETNG